MTKVRTIVNHDKDARLVRPSDLGVGLSPLSAATVLLEVVVAGHAVVYPLSLPVATELARELKKAVKKYVESSSETE